MEQNEYIGVCSSPPRTIYSDTDLLDYLQKLTDDAKYSGRVMLRNSSIERGWRLYETSSENGFLDVREAIINYIENNE